MATAVHSNIRYVRRKPRKRVKRLGSVVVVWWSALALAGLFALNLIYQIVRKPAELLAPVSGSFAKNPASTWENYGELFKEYSTNVISPEFLAALAQIESDGNPIARTYWRWQWSLNPFEIYQPASSALGMFQVTDGTFIDARKYCIEDHAVKDGASCWRNDFYFRTLPSHSIEMTSAYLHRRVVETLAAHPKKKVTLDQKQKLAAVIHLCGARRGEAFTVRGFRVLQEEVCGSHRLSGYLTKVDLMKKRFAKLASGSRSNP
jgi:hypothetical protein